MSEKTSNRILIVVVSLFLLGFDGIFTYLQWYLKEVPFWTALGTSTLFTIIIVAFTVGLTILTAYLDNCITEMIIRHTVKKLIRKYLEEAKKP